MTNSLGQQGNSEEIQEDHMKQSMDIILKWKPTSEVFALKNFIAASAVISGGSAAYINAHYRKVFKLRNHAFLTTLLPMVVAPSIVGGLLHHQFVHRPMLLETFQCPVCVELRGGIVQLFAGFVYPMMLAPLAAMQFAARLFTYPVPDAREPKKVVMELYKLTKPVLPKLYLLAGLQVVAGMAWTHWEYHNLYSILSRMGEMEKTVKEHYKGKWNSD